MQTWLGSISQLMGRRYALGLVAPRLVAPHIRVQLRSMVRLDVTLSALKMRRIIYGASPGREGGLLNIHKQRIGYHLTSLTKLSTKPLQKDHQNSVRDPLHFHCGSWEGQSPPLMYIFQEHLVLPSTPPHLSTPTAITATTMPSLPTPLRYDQLWLCISFAATGRNGAAPIVSQKHQG
jgi:hypothetical protein